MASTPSDDAGVIVPGARDPGDPGPAVSLNAGLSHRYVQAGSPGDVFLRLTLDAAEPRKVRRPGMNLALVIDRSGSMASENKLASAKSAADQLVNRLRPDDHLAIIAYNDEIRTVVPSMPVRERHVFHAAIAGLTSGNSTDLHGGMLAGYEEVLRNYDENRINRVLLISDGLANKGVTEPQQIWTRAGRCRAQGVRISTMGVGLSFDENLMSSIAEHSGGNYHYINQAEGIGLALERELDELSQVVARDVFVSVRPCEGVQVTEVVGYRHELVRERLEIPVSDLYSGERRQIVLRLRVPSDHAVELPVLSVSVRYENAATGERHEARCPPLSIRYTKFAQLIKQHTDIDVMSRVEVVRNAETLALAMQHQKQGQTDLARRILIERYTVSKARNDSEYHSDDIARILARMVHVVQELERTETDAPAARDLQLFTHLRALGYMKK
jgi:Ca-activated chloride channel family protein